MTEQRPEQQSEQDRLEDQQEGDHGVRVTDRRRIDPQTFEVRQVETPGAPGGDVDQAAIVEDELNEVQAQIAELTSDLQRVHAEYANYRKRVERDRELIRELAIGSALAELLPILDDIGRAREHNELDGAFRSVGEALEAVATRLGLEIFGEVNDPFDPSLHEALTSEEREGISEPTVITIYQAGYRHAGRVLRPARVAVAGT